MKGFLFCMFLVFGALLTGPVLEASAQFPMPAAQSPTMKATAPVVAAPQMVAVPAAPAGWSFENIMSLFNTGIAGLIAALLAKLGFAPPTTRVVPAGADPVVDPIAALKAKVTDPALRGTLDSLIGMAANSDLVRGGVRTGLGMVPVAGGILAQLEPGLNALVKKAIADNVPPAAP